MRISISNIAWNIQDDVQVAALLKQHQLDAIDVAPGKYFPDPAQATEAEIQAVRQVWKDRGVDIVGMQSLLFGTQGLNLFGSEQSQEAMLKHLEAVCRIGQGLGATRLVFGSPKNRDRTGFSDAEALQHAVAFFGRLGRVAQDQSVTVCLEPNPPRYGANFMTTAAQTAEVVRAVGHPSIRMQLDTGALTVSGEDLDTVLSRDAELIGHVHISEPDLVPVGTGTTPHAAMAPLLRAKLPHHPVTIEMLSPSTDTGLSAVAHALRVTKDFYS